MAIDISETRLERSELQLWLAWALATAVGMIVGFTPFAFMLAELDLLLLRILVPLWAGFLVGLLQWLVLRPYLTHSVDWILHGGAGWALGYALGLLVIQLIGANPLGRVVGYVLFGVMVAGLQWPMLRREVPNVLAWVAASVVGWALGAYLGGVLVGLIWAGTDPNPAAAAAVMAGTTGLVAGAITGLALVWMARQPEPASMAGPKRP
jgi:hypothetical protein